MEKNIAIIPARSGSKGIRDKNIKLLSGKPLLVYSIETALDSKLFDCIHVSTDSEKYAEIARENGADVPFLRSAAMSSDTAGSWDAVREVIRNYEKIGRKFDTVTLLQPTSPLRNKDDIIGAYKMFLEKDADIVVTVCKSEVSPEICNTLTSDQSMHKFSDDNNRRRQDMPSYYRLNGAVYIIKTNIAKTDFSLYQERSYAYIMPQERSVDIDTELDFKYAEFLIGGADRVKSLPDNK